MSGDVIYSWQLRKHDPSPRCNSQHCYSHGVDEPADKHAYKVCFECNHVYRSAGSLRRADRRARKEIGVPWRRRWHRASTIVVCAFCSHDF